MKNMTIYDASFLSGFFILLAPFVLLPLSMETINLEEVVAYMGSEKLIFSFVFLAGLTLSIYGAYHNYIDDSDLFIH